LDAGEKESEDSEYEKCGMNRLIILIYINNFFFLRLE